MEISLLAKEFGIREEFAANIVRLLDDGNTVPFIARYRKEMTGACDDQVLREFAERLQYLRGLQKRREEIEAQVREQGKWSEELARAVASAATLAELEDLYRPYRPKRRTRAGIAREKGLEPLADRILRQDPHCNPLTEATKFVDPDRGVETAQQALDGACDIIAESVSDNAELRKKLKHFVRVGGKIQSRAVGDDDSVYRAYYEYEEPISKIPPHRILAVNRGEKEEKLKVRIVCGDPTAQIASVYVRGNGTCSDLVQNACTDAWNRLIFPSVEREIRADLFADAAERAIKTFSTNLRALLMQPPIKGKTVLAVDPAYRTGCKIAVVDATGKVLDTGVIYPTPPQKKVEEAERKLLAWIDRFAVDCISIGNGTASKEAEIFVAETLKKTSRPVTYAVVSEAGASVYSASKTGAEEFPQFDVSLRSAVSIARRLQDPLAELVKIEPKAIGVGQYQHDMPPARLDAALAGVVEDCVNRVGADLNTASASLLSYIAGINATVAKNIVAYREEHGIFSSRRELRNVPKLGAKAFEQCAGFLRVSNSVEPLDDTGVHPESYTAARTALKLLGANAGDSDLPKQAEEFGIPSLAQACKVGIPTLRDILDELARPGRDVRDDLPSPILRGDLLDPSDLKEGMILTGTVRNVVDFGAFVDIGVHRDGLVHISQMADRFVRHPDEVVKVGDVVQVRVIEVDTAKERISLSMRQEESAKNDGNLR